MILLSREGPTVKGYLVAKGAGTAGYVSGGRAEIVGQPPTPPSLSLFLPGMKMYTGACGCSALSVRLSVHT